MKKRTHSAILETAVITVALLAYGFLLHPQDPFLTQAGLSPYWLLVLTIALRFGSPIGFVAGCIAGLIYLIGLHTQNVSLHRLLNLNIMQALHPLFFMGTGLAIGSTINMHRKRLAEARQTNEGLQSQLHATEAKRIEMEQAYRTIERQVAGDNQTLVDFSNDLRLLNSATSSHAVYSTLIEILNKQLQTDSCQIWEQTNRGAYRQILSGSAPSPLPLLGTEVLRTRRTTTVRDLIFADTDCGPDDGIIAGPLFNNDVNIMAIVVIQSIPFRKFSYSAQAKFETFLSWASQALKESYNKNQTGTAFSRRTDVELLASDDFMQLCQTELDMIAGDVPSSFMFCRFTQNMDDNTRLKLIAATGRIIRYQTHLHDAIMWHEPSRSFVLFLPATDTASAKMLRERIAYYLSLYDFQPLPNQSLELEYTILDCRKSDDIDEVIYRLREQEVAP